MSSESSGDHSMPGSLPDDISNMVTGHSMSSGHSGGVPTRATRVTLPPDTPTSRAFARALSAPNLADSRLGHVFKTAQGSTSDWVRPCGFLSTLHGGTLAMALWLFCQ